MIRHYLSIVIPILLAALLVSSCQTPPLPGSPENAQVLLLGETHDNGEGHRLRADELRDRIEAGWRPAIAMEQFDREQQPALDGAMRECTDADCVVKRLVPGKSGWNWAFYKPVIALAMQYKLPLLAANLSRADAGKVIKGGIASVLDAATVSRYGLDKSLPAIVLRPQIEEVSTGHCGMLPEAMLEPMARAQIARDVMMADTLRPFASRGAVLIAGNGHVRGDIAVPYWLHTQGLTTLSIGFVEQPGAAGGFDQERRIAVIERPDPCVGLGKKIGDKPGR
ncbi:MAG: ChaN family lipoprotein [Pseudomonadota bacterium]|nr:ChaN family lipoprotein [Pseudomonadota bacterium]